MPNVPQSSVAFRRPTDIYENSTVLRLRKTKLHVCAFAEFAN